MESVVFAASCWGLLGFWGYTAGVMRGGITQPKAVAIMMGPVSLAIALTEKQGNKCPVCGGGNLTTAINCRHCHISLLETQQPRHCCL